MAVSHSLAERGGGAMGNGRWIKVLRFVVCLIITALLMIFTSLNAR